MADRNKIRMSDPLFVESMAHVTNNKHMVTRRFDFSVPGRPVLWWACRLCEAASENAPPLRQFEVTMSMEYVVQGTEKAVVYGRDADHASSKAFHEISLRAEYADKSPDGNTVSVTEVD